MVAPRPFLAFQNTLVTFGLFARFSLTLHFYISELLEAQAIEDWLLRYALLEMGKSDVEHYYRTREGCAFDPRGVLEVKLSTLVTWFSIVLSNFPRVPPIVLS
jgi:hypothetical protein